ncbi:SGNH/GDSL hydrolase family protein [Actinoplanes sp. NEAU-A12]|uniref:SGNH/GDSL hydrolase family protein n=1 Tax=Actinoplanes sandaracinus TaxID=3045177 RepID=A0ABT6WCM8_9ACTN|nr:SGNH/GDSL hydrolase family protein [Actinoplanes sandaracinus]MDI6097512.1 SGNH/GDSL hydrolase family protein [Actinoplanes sandaracinus]
MRRSRFGTIAASMAGLLFCTGTATPALAGPSTPDRPGTSWGAPLRIMPLGDSITVGVGSPGRSGYRIDLQRRLREAGVTTDFVGSQSDGDGGDLDHEGRGGWTVDQIAAQVDHRLAESEPDVVLLHAGTNNITRSEDPAAVAGKLSALIDRVRTRVPDAQVYVATIIGTAVGSEVAANRAYNALIPGLVRAKGPQVHLVDQSTVTGLDIYDRHHPNAFGYRKMAHNWYEAMRATLHPEWPGTGNPYRARQAHLCHAKSPTSRECRMWQVRRVIVSQSDGRTVTAERWQTRRTVKESVRVWEPGHFARHRKGRTWVPGRHVTKNRQVTRWSNV